MKATVVSSLLARVGKLAEIRYHVPLAGQMAVQKISKAGGSKDDACDQVIRRLEGAIRDAAQAGEGHKDQEHRHQQDAGQSELLGRFMDSSNFVILQQYHTDQQQGCCSSHPRTS